MDWKKNMTVVALLLMLTPGAVAFKTSYKGADAVKGHTIFVELIEVEEEKFAAIAAISKEVRVRNSVLWFNDQKLIDERVAEVCFSGNVQIVAAGKPDPETIRGLPVTNVSYLETYRFVDPNDQAWTVDVYNYTVVGVSVPSGPTVLVPVIEMTVFIVDTGACITDPTLQALNFGEDQPDPPPSPHAPTEGADGTTDFDSGCFEAFAINQTCKYNAVNLVRLQYLTGVIEDNEMHANATDACDQVDTGYSHECDGYGGTPSNPDTDETADHFHDTVLVDVYFKTARPARPSPADEVLVVNDTVGSGAAFDEHPCTASATGFPIGSGCP